jgi:hypothetical protein
MQNNTLFTIQCIHEATRIVTLYGTHIIRMWEDGLILLLPIPTIQNNMLCSVYICVYVCVCVCALAPTHMFHVNTIPWAGVQVKSRKTGAKRRHSQKKCLVGDWVIKILLSQSPTRSKDWGLRNLFLGSSTLWASYIFLADYYCSFCVTW